MEPLKLFQGQSQSLQLQLRTLPILIHLTIQAPAQIMAYLAIRVLGIIIIALRVAIIITLAIVPAGGHFLEDFTVIQAAIIMVVTAVITMIMAVTAVITMIMVATVVDVIMEVTTNLLQTHLIVSNSPDLSILRCLQR